MAVPEYSKLLSIWSVKPQRQTIEIMPEIEISEIIIGCCETNAWINSVINNKLLGAQRNPGS